jgi:flagellar biosynthesis protein FlhF
MQIKRFEAKSMTTALSLIKHELGPNAVILSARSLRKGKGFFGSMKYAGVEVTAAIDNHVTTSEYLSGQSENKSYNLYNRRKLRFYNGKENIIDPSTSGYPKQKKTNLSKYLNSEKKSNFLNETSLSLLYDKLLSQDVDKVIANELIEELEEYVVPGETNNEYDLKNQLPLILKKIGIKIDKNAFSFEKAHIAVFIGCTGVGKTTTIAKLAAEQSRKKNKKIAIISIDNYGIAAKKLIKSYADIIGVPIEFASSRADLKNKIEKFNNTDLILIDTPGLNPKNKAFIQEIIKHFKKITNLQTHLVLSATTKQKDLISSIDAFKVFNIDRLLFTKIDESTTYGNILNTLLETKITLSFLCNGKKIFENIKKGSCRKLIELIIQDQHTSNNEFPGNSNILNSRNETKINKNINDNYFVANKNSDVYHHFKCKWAKKIKKENMIQFSSALKAKAQNFLSCSSCKPDQVKNRNFGISPDKIKISSR